MLGYLSDFTSFFELKGWEKRAIAGTAKYNTFSPATSGAPACKHDSLTGTRVVLAVGSTPIRAYFVDRVCSVMWCPPKRPAPWQHRRSFPCNLLWDPNCRCSSDLLLHAIAVRFASVRQLPGCKTSDLRVYFTMPQEPEHRKLSLGCCSCLSS